VRSSSHARIRAGPVPRLDDYFVAIRVFLPSWQACLTAADVVVDETLCYLLRAPPADEHNIMHLISISAISLVVDRYQLSYCRRRRGTTEHLIGAVGPFFFSFFFSPLFLTTAGHSRRGGGLGACARARSAMAAVLPPVAVHAAIGGAVVVAVVARRQAQARRFWRRRPYSRRRQRRRRRRWRW